MQERKKPQRQCIACRACRDKQDLIRVVKTKEGEIMLDRTGRKNGRGAYLCANGVFEKSMEKQRPKPVIPNECKRRNVSIVRKAVKRWYRLERSLVL